MVHPPECMYSSTSVFHAIFSSDSWSCLLPYSRVDIKPTRINDDWWLLYYFDRKLIVVWLALFISDGSNGWYPCPAHTLRPILWVFHTIITPQSTANPVDFVHTICRAIGMPPSVERRWYMLQKWPYHVRGQLGGIRQLCEKVTWLNPKDVSDTHTLLTVHRYASQEHAYKKVSAFNGICWSSTCIRHERRRKSHRQS